MSDDAALLTAWGAGDRAAATELVTRLYDPITRFFTTKAGPEADDLVQRTFLRIGEAAGRYSGEGSPKAFAFGIARNVLFEHIRGRVRDGLADADVRESRIVDLQPGASTLAAQRADQRVLISALQSLPVESQMLLELYYWEDLSVGELAGSLDIPPGTVKSRLHRARTQLRDALDALPQDAPEAGGVRRMVADWIEAPGPTDA